jgi:hypothetical protein
MSDPTDIDDAYVLFSTRDNAFIAFEQPEDNLEVLNVTTDFAQAGIYTRKDAIDTAAENLTLILPLKAVDIRDLLIQATDALNLDADTDADAE